MNITSCSTCVVVNGFNCFDFSLVWVWFCCWRVREFSWDVKWASQITDAYDWNEFEYLIVKFNEWNISNQLNIHTVFSLVKIAADFHLYIFSYFVVSRVERNTDTLIVIFIINSWQLALQNEAKKKKIWKSVCTRNTKKYLQIGIIETNCVETYANQILFFDSFDYY